MLWWIFAALAALIVLICMARVGLRVTFAPGTALLDVTISLFHFRVFPVGKKEVKKDAEETKKAAEKAEETVEKAAKKRLPKITPAQIKSAVRELWPPLRRALRRTRRGICIKPLRLCVSVGGREDPAAAAERYGALQGVVWTAMPALEQLLEIPDPYIHIGLDFDRPDTVAEGIAAISIRVGTLLAVGWTVGVPALRWFLRLQKEEKKTRGSEHTETPAAA